MIKYFKYWCGSELLMRRLSLFLACQHLSSWTNLRVCEEQNWFKVRCFRVPPGLCVPQVETSGLKNRDGKESEFGKINSLLNSTPIVTLSLMFSKHSP
jgi:hypothetical protein